MEPVLDARGLVFTHPGGDRRALDGASLRVGAGECVGLLGPNGAGKTTLVSCATGLLSPRAGSVRICGADPRHAATRRDMGVMLQAAAFPRHLTVRELVGGAAVRAGLPASAAEPVLAEVGLAELTRRRAGRLSGGQQQRLHLARALVTEPRLLILDEPTVGLDSDARRSFWDNLAVRRDGGMAILLTTHLMEEAGAVADRVAVIADGRMVADADPRELANRLPNRTVSATTALDATQVAELPGVLSAVREGSTLRLVSDAPEQVVHHLLHADPALADLRVEGASLEEAVTALASRTDTALALRPAPGSADAVTSMEVSG